MLPTHFIQSQTNSNPADPSRSDTMHSTTQTSTSDNHHYPPTNTNTTSSSSQSTKSSNAFKLTDLTVDTEPTDNKSKIQASRDATTASTTSSNPQTAPKPSKWRSPEFIFYEVVVFMAVSLMTWVPIDISKGE